MSTSKIEDVIDQIEEYIDGCKNTAFSANKIIVNKDDLDEMLHDLRTRTPEEIRKYQRMIANREQILADAKHQADKIIADAQIQTNELISEHQIMQQAYAQANEVILIAQKNAQELIDRATADANQIRLGAIAYTDELLANIQQILTSSIDTTRSRNETFLATMQSYLDTVEANRASLVPDSVNAGESDPAESMETQPAPAAAATSSQTVDDDDLPALDIPEQFFNKE